MTDGPTTPSPRRTGPPATTPAEQSFARRVVIGVGIALGFAALAVFLWYSMYVLLLAFAAVLVGVLLRGSAEWVARKLKVRVAWALLVVIVAGIGSLVLLGMFVAPTLVRQAETLADRIPQTLRLAEEKARSYSWGKRLLGEPDPVAPAAPVTARADAAGGAPQPASLPTSPPTSPPTTQPTSQPTLVSKVVEAGTGPAVVRRATLIVNGFVQGVLTVFVILVSGVYLAAQPRLYVTGLLMLVPHARRERYGEVLGRLGYVLRWWMIGQLVPMVVIGTLTAIGLKVIGMPMWWFLGLLAALFNFIPNFGPLFSGIPAFLLALAESPAKALWVVVLYVVAQSLEGYVLTLSSSAGRWRCRRRC